MCRLQKILGLISLIIGGRGSLMRRNNFPSDPIASFNPFLNSHRVRVLYQLSTFFKALTPIYGFSRSRTFNTPRLDTLCSSSTMGCKAILGSYY